MSTDQKRLHINVSSLPPGWADDLVTLIIQLINGHASEFQVEESKHSKDGLYVSFRGPPLMNFFDDQVSVLAERKKDFDGAVFQVSLESEEAKRILKPDLRLELLQKIKEIKFRQDEDFQKFVAVREVLFDAATTLKLPSCT